MFVRDDSPVSADRGQHDLARVWRVIHGRRAARQARRDPPALRLPTLDTDEIEQVAAVQQNWRDRHWLLGTTGQPPESWSAHPGRATPAARILLPNPRWPIPWTAGLYVLYAQGAEAAVDEVAKRVAWRPRGRVQGVLRRNAAVEQRPYKDVKREALVTGVLPALLDGRRAQRIRLGGQWIKDEHGAVSVVLPIGRSRAEFHQWWRKEIINAAEAYLLGAAYPDLGGNHDVLDLLHASPADYLDNRLEGGLKGRQRCCTAFTPEIEDTLPDAHASDPLDALIAQESAAESRIQLAEVLEGCTPAERDVLLMAQQHVENRGDLNLTVLAQELGIAPGTIRAHFHHIREKARPGRVRA
jgi:hypothetical protein